MFRNPTTDLIIVLVIVLLIFGPKRLPSLGKQLGSTARDFKDSITRHHNDDDDEDDRRPEIAHASQPPVAPPSETSTADRQPAEAAPARSTSDGGSDRSS
jgi:sec-independent protein translocase protein TatA